MPGAATGMPQPYSFITFSFFISPPNLLWPWLLPSECRLRRAHISHRRSLHTAVSGSRLQPLQIRTIPSASDSDSYRTRSQIPLRYSPFLSPFLSCRLIRKAQCSHAQYSRKTRKLQPEISYKRIWKVYMQLFRPLFPRQGYTVSEKRWYSVNYGELHFCSLSLPRYETSAARKLHNSYFPSEWECTFSLQLHETALSGLIFHLRSLWFCDILLARRCDV